MTAGDSAGLWAHCAWARLVESARGSRFLRCGRSDEDSNYARYPALPVRSCGGFERKTDEGRGGAELRS